MGGIGGLLGLLGVLGFAGFLGGIALVVVWSSQNRPVRAFFPLIALALVVGIGFSVIGQGLIVVEPQEVAVVFNTLDGSLGEPRRAGTHIIFPVLQQSTIYPISFQEYTMSGVGNEGRVQGDDAVRVRTSDGQEVLLDITPVSYTHLGYGYRFRFAPVRSRGFRRKPPRRGTRSPHRERNRGAEDAQDQLHIGSASVREQC